ncbi:sensor histidine kinase [Flexithrix dorotheae]|uniref:sensor histidine kinase n=1 Tax=Flexithrix dorotheae TaxID=70993 RepID=UPI00038223B3|nr:histidine kinase [Flexithrix dorotheae]
MRFVWQQLLIFCFSYQVVLAQHPITINMDEKDGLPDVDFYNILRDQNDLFWLAAHSGLFQYNGTDFKKIDSKKQKGLSVYNLTTDSSNRVWCVNLYGQIMYAQNDSLHIFKDLHEVLKGNLANIFIEGNDLAVVWEDGILIFDIETTAQKFYKKIHKIATQKTNDKIYVLTPEGVIYTLDKDYNLKKQYSLNSRHINDLGVFFTYQQNVYLTYWENQHRHFINLTSGSPLKPHLFKELDAIKIIQVKEIDQQLWFATNKGVFVYKKNNEDSWQCNAHYLANEIISDIYKDVDENYWFTTLNNGIFVMPNILIGKYKDIPLTGNIASLEAIGNNLVAVGTTQGKVYFLNTKTEEIQEIVLSQLKTVNNLFFNPSRNELYISLNGSLSFCYDFNTNTLKKAGNKFAISKGLAITKSDIVYLTYNRAHVYLNAFTEKEEIKPLEKKRSYSVLSDSANNQVYLGYIDELVKYDSLWKPTPLTVNGENILVSKLKQTENGVIWANVNHMGLAAIQGDSIEIKYNSKGGLIDNNLSHIEVAGNNLWCSYKGFLQYINTETNKITTINRQDGLENLITGLAISDSLLIFSSRKEVYALPIYNDLLFKRRKVPEAYFTKLVIGNTEAKLKDKYELSHEKNSIAFHFHANSFETAKHLKFKYKLHGFDTQWRTTDYGISSVEYNSLPAGNFTFEIKTISANGELESPGKKIELFIPLPFWKELWFTLLCIVVYFGALYFYYQKKMKKKEEEQNRMFDKLVQEKKFTTLKLENLRSQMNPHFIFNALNSIQEYIISNQKNLASSYLVKFSRLIRIYLQHSQVNEVTLSAELEALSLYLELEKIRFEEELIYHLEIAEGVNTRQIKVPSIFIQPYVENAIKHGLLHKKNNRRLEIKFELSDSKTRLLCQIEDNGVGREAAERIKNQNNFHPSFATKANQERIDLYNLNRSNKISVEIHDIKENDKALGTLVHISIPIQKH